ncbi:extensin-like [Ctenocephalides felis]|uniref:extensin-like n=1 Tax=Ctenocephalides felis TaxID=7515 RepID=UPI000E6E1B91|nr:extensin-like [Ctenocephalides felis]
MHTKGYFSSIFEIHNLLWKFDIIPLDIELAKMSPSITLAVFLLGTIIVCNAEYRYKFRPPRMPAPQGGAIYKKWPMVSHHPQASNRAYRKPPAIYRYPPPPPSPKRPPFYRRPYKSSSHIHIPMWKPKPIFPNPYQQIPISIKDQQYAVKGPQYFKDPQLKEPIYLKNPKFYDEYVLRQQSQAPAPAALTSPYQHTANSQHLQNPSNIHGGQTPPKQQHYSYPQPVSHQHFQLADVADRESPIRTIPAPNLSGAGASFAQGPPPKALALQQPVKATYIGNNAGSFHQLPNTASFYQPEPAKLTGLHQYHVTEPSNDVRIKDHLSGASTLFAPDPDPKLPAAPIFKINDPFSMPSNGKPLPPDVQHYATQQTQTQSQKTKGLTTQEFYDLLNSFPLPHNQEATSSNLYQAAHQPQLHQHLLQQAHGLPIPGLSVGPQRPMPFF